MENKILKELEFQNNNDGRGELVIIENSKIIPFDIKRLFYIYDVKDDKSRGNHANKDSEFVMIALKGSVKIKVDNGEKKEDILLNNPKKGIHIPKLTWKEMYDFSEDCILLVLSNNHYDATEYIKEYNEFLEYANEKK